MEVEVGAGVIAGCETRDRFLEKKDKSFILIVHTKIFGTAGDC